MTYKYVGPAFLKSNLQWLVPDGVTVFHRVEEVDIQRLTVDEAELLTKFENVKRLKLTNVYGVEGIAWENLFPDWKIMSRRPQVDELVFLRP